LKRADGMCFAAQGNEIPEAGPAGIKKGNETPEAKPLTCWSAAAMPRPAKQDTRKLQRMKGSIL